MKTQIEAILKSFLDSKFYSPEDADSVISILKKEEGLSVKELFSFIDTLTSGFEIKMFGSFSGRILGATDSLDNAVARTIEWENLPADEIMEIVEMTGANRHRYNDLTAKLAVLSNKLSVENMLTLIDSGKLHNHCNLTLGSMIKTQQFSKEQVLRIVACSHHWTVTSKAIETQLFSVEEMFSLWSKSYKDHAVAMAMVKTGLISNKDIKTLAGNNTGLLNELTRAMI